MLPVTAPKRKPDDRCGHQHDCGKGSNFASDRPKLLRIPRAVVVASASGRAVARGWRGRDKPRTTSHQQPTLTRCSRTRALQPAPRKQRPLDLLRVTAVPLPGRLILAPSPYRRWTAPTVDRSILFACHRCDARPPTIERRQTSTERDRAALDGASADPAVGGALAGFRR